MIFHNGTNSASHQGPILTMMIQIQTPPRRYRPFTYNYDSYSVAFFTCEPQCFLVTNSLFIWLLLLFSNIYFLISHIRTLPANNRNLLCESILEIKQFDN